ncbi:hypothetical protein EVAR_95556_1 [Eumeta japonica]|uniref:Uncharacterized protein n=1 Tax=Eumeta variegata TaxID=151549 RepID=A0A4C2A0R1_EUMVA|nr:hypothetical protein EVAR_95556_1 [Eumeta japonica]
MTRRQEADEQTQSPFITSAQPRRKPDSRQGRGRPARAAHTLAKTDYFAQHTDYVASARIRRGPTVKRSVKGACGKPQPFGEQQKEKVVYLGYLIILLATQLSILNIWPPDFHALRSLDTCNPGTLVTYDLDKVISLSNRRPSYAVRSSWQYGYRFHKQCGLPIAFKYNSSMRHNID